MFVIPAREIGSLYPYFVLEEFLGHLCNFITLFQKDKERLYLGRRGDCPLLIPAQYHKWRFTVDVTEKDAKFSKPDVAANRKWEMLSGSDIIWGNLPKTLRAMLVNGLLQTGKKQVYLGPLTHQLKSVAII